MLVKVVLRRVKDAVESKFFEISDIVLALSRDAFLKPALRVVSSLSPLSLPAIAAAPVSNIAPIASFKVPVAIILEAFARTGPHVCILILDVAASLSTLSLATSKLFIYLFIKLASKGEVSRVGSIGAGVAVASITTSSSSSIPLFTRGKNILSSRPASNFSPRLK